MRRDAISQQKYEEDPGMIPIIDNVFMAFPDAWRDFGEMAGHDIRNNSARKLELLKFTSERVALFEDNMTKEDIPRYRRHAKELIDFYKSAPSLKNVWHEQPHDAMDRNR